MARPDRYRQAVPLYVVDIARQHVASRHERRRRIPPTLAALALILVVLVVLLVSFR